MKGESSLRAWADQTKMCPTPAPADGAPRFSPEEWWQVLARQTALYTNMESNSVPLETAEELMESMLFCVQTAWKAGAQVKTTECASNDGSSPLPGWLLEGQRILAGRQQAGLYLQKAAQTACLPLDNAVYCDVFTETRRFFTWYDIRFLAHKIPCMLDYPLALPVDEVQKGVDYINEYMCRRLWEDEFCGHFSLSWVEAALAHHVPGWKDLPVNLFEPVITRALGGMLQPTGNGEKLAAGLDRAASRLCNRLQIWDTARRGYYRRYAATLAPRVLAADAEGLARMFG